jgi:hypothetical protein
VIENLSAGRPKAAIEPLPFAHMEMAEKKSHHGQPQEIGG